MLCREENKLICEGEANSIVLSAKVAMSKEPFKKINVPDHAVRVYLTQISKLYGDLAASRNRNIYDYDPYIRFPASYLSEFEAVINDEVRIPFSLQLRNLQLKLRP